jgi:hypothetical protein
VGSSPITSSGIYFTQSKKQKDQNGADWLIHNDWSKVPNLTESKADVAWLKDGRLTGRINVYRCIVRQSQLPC